MIAISYYVAVSSGRAIVPLPPRMITRIAKCLNVGDTIKARVLITLEAIVPFLATIVDDDHQWVATTVRLEMSLALVGHQGGR